MTLVDVIINLLPMILYTAVTFSIAGYYYVGSRNAEMRALGFKMCVFANIMWIVYAMFIRSKIELLVVITFFALFLLSLRGTWNNTDVIDPELHDYMIKNGLLVRQEDKK